MLLPVPSRITSKINLLHTNLCFRVSLLETPPKIPWLYGSYKVAIAVACILPVSNPVGRELPNTFI